MSRYENRPAALVSDSTSFDLLWICCTTSCTTNPQQIESQLQVHNRSSQQVVEQTASLTASPQHIHSLSLWLIGTVRAEPETVISRAWVQSPVKTTGVNWGATVAVAWDAKVQPQPQANSNSHRLVIFLLFSSLEAVRDRRTDGRTGPVMRHISTSA